jgi:EAL domain-containing protein (putative c-di-GMP-specific phosphodiesterase class I)
LALQAAAIVGVLAIILLIARSVDIRPDNRELFSGLAFGLVAFAITWFASDALQNRVVKPYLILDVLLLGGLLGGWRGGFVTFLGAFTARWIFGGPMEPMTVVLNAAIPLLVGAGLHRAAFERLLSTFSLSNVLMIWSARIVATVLSTLVAYGPFSSFSTHDFQRLIAMRVCFLPLSFVILYMTLLLLYSDAQFDAQRQREHQLARIDSVTGLPNRKALSEHLEQFWHSAQHRPACLIVLELCNLQEFLVRYGHQMGEALWARWLSALTIADVALQSNKLHLRNPVFFQYADFTMAVLLEDVAIKELEGSREVDDFLDNMRFLMKKTWSDFVPNLRCAVVDLRDGNRLSSPGEPTAISSETIPYHNITLALDSVASGVAYFNDLLIEDKRLNDYIDQQLTAWLNEPLRTPLCFQPKVRLSDKAVVGAEALLRMKDRDGEAISAMRAIAVFTRRKRLKEFEWATLLAVVRTLEPIHKDLPTHVALAVNISAESLQCEEFAAAVAELLATSGLPPHFIKLEVVEWSEILESPAVQGNMDRLARQGVPLSIDDFGVGYSNLLLLSRVSFSELKIDQSLISSIRESKSLTLIRLITDMAHSNDAVVVAEGIETPEIEAIVRSLDVDVGQGYLYSRAIPFDELRKLLAGEVTGDSDASTAKGVPATGVKALEIHT